GGWAKSGRQQSMVRASIGVSPSWVPVSAGANQHRRIHVRPIVKLGAPLVAAALALAAGGGTTGGSTDAGGSSSSGGSGKNCNLQIGFFGALTGDAANLGQNIKNGAKLAIKQYNEKHKDCQVKLKQFDSQGS